MRFGAAGSSSGAANAVSLFNSRTSFINKGIKTSFITDSSTNIDLGLVWFILFYFTLYSCQ
jgi:hypothetical protein